MSYLETIHTPADLKGLNTEQLEELCAEIRQLLVEKISVSGGHLSSNLGTVELTVALHRCFSSPDDPILFDVGHQCYTHKLLTGRKQGFDAMRQAGGLAGFPCPQESVHDPLMEGHGNVALSQAVGLAQAKKLQGKPGYVVAVIGDGAFTGGMVYEGINNIAGLDNLVVILNDNKMSISKNVGAISRYFTRLRTDAAYHRVKRNVQTFLEGVPLLGPPVARLLGWAKDMLRRLIYHSTWFEDMGFAYYGPLDGHDLDALCEAFEAPRGQGKPLFYHVVTVKGKGFQPAEDNPGAFHGVPSFDINRVPSLDPDISPVDSFSEEFGRALCEEARRDGRICAVTAAMKYGTGLHHMRKAFPDRTFDVGMAEQHAVTFAAGLARGGMLPVVAIYSTFLQRSYDQIIHDVALNDADVLLAVDRAGLVPGDGATHQGIYDVAFLSQLEKMQVVCPANYAELRHWLHRLLQQKGPRALRYPRGNPPPPLEALGCSGQPYDVWRGAALGEGTAFEKENTLEKGAALKKGADPADLEERADLAKEAVLEKETPGTKGATEAEQSSEMEEVSQEKSAPGATAKPADVALVCYGALLEECLPACRQLAPRADLFKLTVLHPLPSGLARQLAGYRAILFAEECVATGSVGQQLYQQLGQAGFRGRFCHRCLPNRIDHATIPQLRCQLGLNAAALVRTVQEELLED